MNSHPLSTRYHAIDQRRRRWLAVRSALRIAFNAVLLLVGYALVPLDRTNIDTPVRLVIALTFVCLIITVQIRSIRSASYPGLRAIEALLTAILVLIVAFSLLYLDIAHYNPHYFSQPLDRVSAFYFTVTVLSTVGFGDITATNDVSRIVVTIQMLLDLTFLAIIIRVFFFAAQSRASAVEEEEAARHMDADRDVDRT